MAASPHVTAANKYAKNVVSGKSVACITIKQAAQRYLDDLKRSKKRDYPYKFDKELAEDACEFIELLPHTKGEWAQRRELLKLEPCQCFLVVQLFGWIHKKTGKRRFRECYYKVSRKNAKSVLAAAIGIYGFCADYEYGAEIYSGATTEKQAWEIFKPARLMCKKSPELMSYYGIEVNAKNLSIPNEGSKFEPIIGNPGDGASPSFALIDEYHEHKNADLYDTMDTGMGARSQPLKFITTTAGKSYAGPCYEKEKECKQVLEGTLDIPTLLVIIYEADPDTDWKSLKALKQANPMMGVSVNVDYLKNQQFLAIQNATRANTFQTKHLNLWVGSDTAYFNMAKWEKCADPSLKISDFVGEECVFALDLASKLDICAWLIAFKRVIKGKDHYYFFCRFYVPEETVENLQHFKESYEGWINRGLLTETDGDEIDFENLKDEILEEHAKYQVEEIAYDPWRATHLSHQLAAAGAETVEVANNRRVLSEAMKELDAAIISGRAHHDGNDVLTWMISNVCANADDNDNVMPKKDKAAPQNKIDGAVAAIMAVSRLMSPAETSEVDTSYMEIA